MKRQNRMIKAHTNNNDNNNIRALVRLRPDVSARLQEVAAAKGMTVDELANLILEDVAKQER
jgi:antitoxin component of RelBE/YafQ-DinJ toxin-antitoxin module